ncbi:MAG: phosphoglucomutase/phosphomannomutase PgmG, partial [Alphaproteobacteria bacterium]
YDIRGIVGDTLSEQDAYALGRAYAAMLAPSGGRKVAIGFDGRDSSPGFEAALAKGLADSGMDVCRIGLASTPTLYFAVYELEADGGIMVTGSHNPSEYNGFKLVLGRRALYGDDIQELGRIAAGGAFVDGAGSLSDTPVMQQHIDRIVADNPISRSMKVVWDPGHGAPAAILPALTARLPGDHILINCEVDARFPAHHPDPTQAENLVQLQEEVRRQGADFGVAFDGDGDRIGIVDGEGEILWADQLLVLLAQDVLATHPGATIIADVKASQILFDSVEAAGGTPLMWRTGHSLIKAKMAETGSPLAGEMSGHIFFADRYFGFDDALYAAARTLSILAASGQSLADFRRALPVALNTPELRFDCAEERKFAVVDEVIERLKASGGDVIAVDGVRVKLGDGWWLLRASNTQNALVARCEARSAEGLAGAKVALVEQLGLSGITAPDF